MLGLSVATRILLFTEAVDMRKGFDGLSAIVVGAGEDVYSGCLYVFVSSRRDRAKILTFQKGGLVLWYKRLSRGRFASCAKRMKGVPMSKSIQRSLLLMLEGIEFKGAKRRKRYTHKLD